MDFFAQQAIARRQSRRLIVFFLLAVACIMAAIAFVVVLALDLGMSPDERAAAGAGLLARHPNAGIGSALVTLAVIGIASLFKVGRLRSGGGVVARELGGTLVPGEPRDRQLRRLRNVVEEISIASGVPVPEIYVLEQEAGINAFAAGWSPADAAVAVTRGALDRLSRDELQGVIAHEFSHVLNGDMRLNIRLMGVLFGILVIGIAAREFLLRARGGGKDGAALLVIALAVMIIGWVGLFFGRIIKAGVSRQREYLADASAVQFTRQNHGLAGALKKIAATSEGSQLTAHDAEEVSHMLFGDGVGYSALFATHPPLLERIKRIDRQFDPRELPAAALAAASTPGAAPDEEWDAAPVSRIAGAAAAPADGGPVVLPRADARVALGSRQVLSQVGNPASDDFRTAAAIAAAIPAGLRALAHAQEHAAALVVALALDGDADASARQVQRVATAFDDGFAGEVRGLRAQLGELHPLQRLPLAAMAFPQLRRRPRPWLVRFIALLDELAHLDGVVQLPEYCLLRMLRTQVSDALDPSSGGGMGSRRLGESKAEIAGLLAVLAQSGHADEESARRAYLAGILAIFPTGAPNYAPPKAWAEALDRAWPVLDRLNPPSKALLLEGLVKAIGHDGRCALAEAELLRTICAALHCPLPPQLAA
jgi:Zn-dependent protease with chaperone function